MALLILWLWWSNQNVCLQSLKRCFWKRQLLISVLKNKTIRSKNTTEEVSLPWWWNHRILQHPLLPRSGPHFQSRRLNLGVKELRVWNEWTSKRLNKRNRKLSWRCRHCGEIWHGMRLLVCFCFSFLLFSDTPTCVRLVLLYRKLLTSKVLVSRLLHDIT